MTGRLAAAALTAAVLLLTGAPACADGVEVVVRDVAGHPVKEVQAWLVIDAPPARVFEVLLDWRQFPQFMPYLAEVRLVEVPASGAEWYLYQRVSTGFFMVADRDYTLRHRKIEDPSRGRFELRWEAANDQGPAPQPGVVRVKLCTGSYLVESEDSGRRTRLTYRLHTDPELPAWLANQANRFSVPSLLEAIARRSVDGRWTRSSAGGKL